MPTKADSYKPLPKPYHHEFAVGSDGVVIRRSGRGRMRVKVPAVFAAGRLVVRLETEGGAPKVGDVARLVLTVHRRPMPPTYFPVFLDGDPRNCRLDNLAWDVRKMLPVWLPRESFNDLADVANREGRTPAGLVEGLVLEYIGRRPRRR